MISANVLTHSLFGGDIKGRAVLLRQSKAVHVFDKEVIIACGEMRFRSEHNLVDLVRITKSFPCQGRKYNTSRIGSRKFYAFPQCAVLHRRASARARAGGSGTATQ